MENLLKTSQLLVKLSSLGLLDTTFKNLAKVRKTPLPTTKLTKIPTVKNTIGSSSSSSSSSGSMGIAPKLDGSGIENPIGKLMPGGINAY